MQSFLVVVLSSLVALAQSASVIPIDTSSVNVKQSGSDYAYSIHESRGVAIDPSVEIIHQQQAHQLQPVVERTRPMGVMENLVNRAGQGQVQTRISHQQQLAPQVKAITNQIYHGSLALPLAPITTYNYLPTYGLTYPYGIQHPHPYPYNLIHTV